MISPGVSNPIQLCKLLCWLPVPKTLLARLLPASRVHIIVIKNRHPGDFMDTRHSVFGSRILAAVATFALTAGTVAVAQQTTAPSGTDQSAPSSTTATKPSKAERKAHRKERKEKM